MPFRAGYDDDNQMKNDISSDIDSVSHVGGGGAYAAAGVRPGVESESKTETGV